MGSRSQIKFEYEKHHRRSIRLHGYDYAQAGAYFVTIVAYQRECLFGEITIGEMKLNNFGNIADECWRAIPEHFPEVELGAHVVMPNHVHGIIVITDNIVVGATHASPLHASPLHASPPHASPPHNVPPRGAPPGSLGAIVGSFKSAVTRRIGQELSATGIWQRNYYERIIRDEGEMDAFWRYIESNPSMWKEDQENRVSKRPRKRCSSNLRQ